MLEGIERERKRTTKEKRTNAALVMVIYEKRGIKMVHFGGFEIDELRKVPGAAAAGNKDC